MAAARTSAEVKALTEEWLAGRASPHTRRRYRRDLGWFAAWLTAHRGRGLLDARVEDVLAFARARAGSREGLDHRVHPLRRHNTVATAATAWSSFYNHCVERGVLDSNPVAAARGLDAAAAYPPHEHGSARRLDETTLRTLLVHAHRDPWLGGALGTAAIGLLIATRWRPERVVTLNLDAALALPDLPAPVLEHLHAYAEEERPHPARGPRLFWDRSGVRALSTIDLMRLVVRCAERAGLGGEVTATRVARAAGELHARGVPLDLPGLAELRRDAAGQQQMALPDEPGGYEPADVSGQQALIPLPPGVPRPRASHTPRWPRRTR
jgi:hypothetical protein